MIRIGLLGEAPNDTSAIKNLLKQHFGERIDFFPMLRDYNGDNLDTKDANDRLRKEFQIEKPDLVIYIRDSDALETNKKQIDFRKAAFSEKRRRVEGRAILLLIVVEAEALVLADIEGYIEYHLKRQIRWARAITTEQLEAIRAEKLALFSHINDPMLDPDPKKTLMEIGSLPYDESRLAGVSEYLRLPVVLQNHRGFALFFKRFLKKFDRLEGRIS